METSVQSMDIIWNLVLATIIVLAPGVAFWLIVSAVALTLRRVRRIGVLRRNMNQEKVALT